MREPHLQRTDASFNGVESSGTVVDDRVDTDRITQEPGDEPASKKAPVGLEAAFEEW